MYFDGLSQKRGPYAILSRPIKYRIGGSCKAENTRQYSQCTKHEEQVEHNFSFILSVVMLRSNMNRIDWVKRDTLDTDAHFWSEMKIYEKRKSRPACFRIEGAYFDLTVYLPDVVVSRCRLDTPAIKRICQWDIFWKIVSNKTIYHYWPSLECRDSGCQTLRNYGHFYSFFWKLFTGVIKVC